MISRGDNVEYSCSMSVKNHDPFQVEMLSNIFTNKGQFV